MCASPAADQVAFRALELAGREGGTGSPEWWKPE